MSKPYQHVRIPLSLILDSPGLKASTIAVYVALASFADVNGIAWPSIKTTAMRAKVSQATVRKEIHRLESYGLLIIKPRTEIIGGKSMSTSHLYTLTWHKKYLKNESKIFEVLEMNQGLSSGDTTPTIKRERRTTTNINHNQVNQRVVQKLADELVARAWSSQGSTQSEKDISSIIELSLRNGISYEKLETALSSLAKEGSYISKFSLAQALGPSARIRGKLQADLPVNWDGESEQL